MPVCFVPFYLQAICQFTPLLKLRPPIFGLTLFGWLAGLFISIFLRRISFLFCPIFQEHNLSIKQGPCL
jgi:hypothetical protein